MSQKQCIADVIKLRMNAALDELNAHEKTRIYAQKLYEEIRGELVINGMNPRVVAGSLIWIAAVWTLDSITQKTAAKAIGMRGASISHGYRRFKHFFEEHNTFSRIYREMNDED